MFIYLQNETENYSQPNTKTEDQIRKLTTQEDLDETKRIHFLLTKGEIVQKRAIGDNLSGFVLKFPNAFIQIFPILRELVKQPDQQLQLNLSRQLKKILISQLQIDYKLYSQIVALTLQMLEQWNQKITDNWLEIFEIIVKRSDYSLFQKQILSTINRLADGKQILPIKMVAAKAIAHLSHVLKNRLKGTLLDRIRTFCRDPEKQLRLTILRQVLPKLIINLTVDLFGSSFIQKIFDMVYDKDHEISLEALSLIFNNCQYFSNQQKDTRILKILIQNLQNISNTDIQILFSLNLGNIYIKLKQQIQKNQTTSTIFLNSIKRYANSQNHQIVLNFLYNLPGLLHLIGSKLWSQISQSYIRIINKQQQIQTKALGLLIFHQVIQILGNKNFQEYPIIFCNIIQNLSQKKSQNKQMVLKVFPSLLQNLDLIIINIIKLGSKIQENEPILQFVNKNLEKIFKSIVQIIILLRSYNKSQLVKKTHQKMRDLLKYFNSEQIIKQYVPILFLELNRSNKLTVEQVLGSLSQILYLNMGKIQMDILLNKLKSQYYQSKSFVKRLIYIRFAKKMIDYLSFQKYRQLGFISSCLKYGQDPILSIQFQMIDYLAICLKSIILLQSEKLAIITLLDNYNLSPHTLIQQHINKFNKSLQSQTNDSRIQKQIKNKQKLRYQQTILLQPKNPSQAMVLSLQFQQLIKPQKKNVIVFKQKKGQFATKYAATRLKTKINISLSTNALSLQNSVKSQQMRQKEKKSNIVQSIKKVPEIQIKNIKSNLKKVTLAKDQDRKQKPLTVSMIAGKKKPSVQSHTFKDILRGDIDKRSSLEISKKRKNVTEKKIND